MPTFIPVDRSPRAATRHARWPSVALGACVVGAVISLFVTVQWSPQAGWVFLFFFFASFIANGVRGAVGAREEADVAPVRLAWHARVIVAGVCLTSGLALALVAHHFFGTSIVVWFAFLLGAGIGGRIYFAVILGRFIARLRPPLDAEWPVLGLDLALGLVATSFEQTPSDSPGWANVVARSVTSAYDAGLDAGRAGDPRRATHLTLTRETLHGQPEAAQAAWADVIDAARRGIAAGELESREPTP